MQIAIKSKQQQKTIRIAAHFMLFTFVQHYMPRKPNVTEDMNEQCNERFKRPRHVSMRQLTKCKRSLHSPAPIGTISLNSRNISFCRYFCINTGGYSSVPSFWCCRNATQISFSRGTKSPLQPLMSRETANVFLTDRAVGT